MLVHIGENAQLLLFLLDLFLLTPFIHSMRIHQAMSVTPFFSETSFPCLPYSLGHLWAEWERGGILLIACDSE